MKATTRAFVLGVTVGMVAHYVWMGAKPATVTA